jgi:hypothetical protein
VRVHILGASGSGTSTLGQALAERLGCPLLDVDDYFWLPTDPPFQQIRDVSERQALLGAAIGRSPTCVISGSLSDWGDRFIPLFDLVVFLWLPPAIRLARLAARERRLFGEEALAPGVPRAVAPDLALPGPAPRRRRHRRGAPGGGHAAPGVRGLKSTSTLDGRYATNGEKGRAPALFGVAEPRTNGRRSRSTGRRPHP